MHDTILYRVFQWHLYHGNCAICASTGMYAVYIGVQYAYVRRACCCSQLQTAELAQSEIVTAMSWDV